VKSIAPALVKVQAAMKGIGKSGFNQYDKYAYATLLDYIEAARPVLSEHGMAVMFSIGESIRLPERTTSQGKTEHAVQIKTTARLIHSSGEWVEIDVYGEGQDRSDKGVYKAITGARKYAIACVLGLATTDDPENDADGRNAPQAPPPAQRPVAASTNGKRKKPAVKGGVAPSPATAAKQEFIQHVREWVGATPDEAVKHAARILAHVRPGHANPATIEDITAADDFVTRNQLEEIPYADAIPQE